MNYTHAVVTGASKGIGAAIARALVKQGLKVYAIARNEQALAALRLELGENLIPLSIDIRNYDAIMAALDGCPIDVLVNNAGGLGSVRPLYSQTAQETDEVIEINLNVPLQLMRLILPGMIERRRGHIFNLTSTASLTVFTGTTAYGAAKAGLSHASRILRYDLAGTGVRLTEIAPGRVETDFYLRAFGGDQAALKQRMYKEQRPLRPVDIAEILISALAMPDHVDVAEILVSPSEQAAGGFIYPSPPPPQEENS